MTSALIPTLGTVQQILQVFPYNFKTEPNVRDFQATPEVTKMPEEQPNQRKVEAFGFWSIWGRSCCATLWLPCKGSRERGLE